MEWGCVDLFWAVRKKRRSCCALDSEASELVTAPVGPSTHKNLLNSLLDISSFKRREIHRHQWLERRCWLFRDPSMSESEDHDDQILELTTAPISSRSQKPTQQACTLSYTLPATGLIYQGAPVSFYIQQFLLHWL